MEYQTIRYTVEEGVALITMARADKMNAPISIEERTNPCSLV